MTMQDLINNKKFLFFGGKGGVGKTTMASSTAVWLADQGYDTLVVATDPTVSLSAIFEQQIGETEVTRIKEVKNLCGLNINPKKASGVFQARLNHMVDELTGMFGKEVMSTPCAEEMAAFDQFVSYLNSDEHDIIVFDTAPTGHTLRELSMPFDWANYISRQLQNRLVLGKLLNIKVGGDTLDNLNIEQKRYENAIKILADTKTTLFTLVLLAENLPIEETARAIENLSQLKINVPALIINEIIPTEVLKGNWFLEKRRSTQDRYLDIIGKRFKDLYKKEVPLFETDITGIENMRKIGKILYG
ncbi:MAG: putative arsenical pump-driving ATPase [Candidatus Methanoperedens nitroreducens]|uniref:Putative arsenical pump-driving ATPase n=1 Tax=Candidatus Methanoperedens nitratireducens TaxID=1392998 RepID=A0A0P8AJN5_9EURY|nr:TRC40/GET3/ArsA family transport-energizing ATPase [Candidatus Methanoperedens sp. BLZ2]KPQ44926.1 MAG: putative arsenical pump-driving ATPase [Candidatus Methanoperedens sp. BLZ1]MBZ0177579.1 arsenical pump-driving ATPase GET3 [Candidatus Methanoperedens nitroreducens]MCX9078063.1 TRC40/GET3/ArsA family transport-energizing ATPase [Candidatus Methanoperedens sp.]MCX9086212.1 TRC40/GET3/ArsA family transport-energizing ATPase [Candidatus Methanoperedens sp.]